ncbi:prepilin-type N-terminal cleavage/methylation domain-containing protein [Variovorax sp. M-6]|uniref:type IV pilus modification PilV family protein n=1 Tax=Variovorax sp. M-6 TaxID=3233041 RepID=UPI003F99A998
MLKNAGRPYRQRGITLLESLVSLAILVLVAFGLLGVQLRTLADARTTVHRTQAIRLVEDLAERVRAHPGRMRPLPAEAAQWDLPPPLPDCRTTACEPTALARWEIARWKQAVASALPLGRSVVFEITDSPRQLGVMVAWHANAKGLSDPALDTPFRVDSLAAGVRCPAGLLCHLAHVHP